MSATAQAVPDAGRRGPVVSVFRSGLLAPASDLGPAHGVTLAADRVCPEGRQTRLGGLFAAPTLAGVARWVRGNDLAGQASRPWELRIRAEGVWVYEVRAWERVRDETDVAAMAAYWATGMPLDVWRDSGLDPSSWEVLVPPGLVRSTRAVSLPRLTGGLDEDQAWMRPHLARIARSWSRTG